MGLPRLKAPLVAAWMKTNPFSANTEVNAPCEPSRWEVEDFLTGFTRRAYWAPKESQIRKDLRPTQNRFFGRASPCQNGWGQGVLLQEIPDRFWDR